VWGELKFPVFLSFKTQKMEAIQTPFNAAQQELLQLFAAGLSDEELRELKQILLDFKFRRVTTLADKVWDEKGWNDETVEKILQTHLRTPYKKDS